MTLMDTDRRSLLKILGLGTVGAVTGVGTLALSSQPVSASFTLQSGDVTVEHPAGKLTKVYMDPTGSLTWSNFDTEVHAVRVTLDTKLGDGNWSTATAETVPVETPGFSGSESYDGAQGNNGLQLYTGNLIDRADDGETASITLAYEFSIDLLDIDGEPVTPTPQASFVESGQSVISVTNLEAGRGATINPGVGAE
jgi:hypothetical protein